ncbi:MAG: peroxiredoxin family protein [Nitrospinota bacterium]
MNVSAIQEKESGGSEKTSIAPEVMLTRLDGVEVMLGDYRGKWVFLNFWATWCPPCVWEMPAMEKLYQKFKKHNFAMLAISIDKGNPRKVRKFVARYKLTFEIFHNPKGDVAEAFGVSGLPTTYIINPTGQMTLLASGARDWPDEKEIDHLRKLMSIKNGRN